MRRGVVWTLLTVLVCAVVAAPGSAEAAFSGARNHGKPFCPKGAVFSARKGGECWTCSGRKRTLAPVTSGKACRRPGYNQFRKAHLAKPRGKIVKAKCAKGYRLDALKGACYRCDGGWKRSVHSVTSGKACFKRVKARHYGASYVKKFGCGRGQVFSLRQGGQCWSCPRGYVRTIGAVNGQRACTNNFGEIFAANKGAMCRKVVTALREGGRAVAKLSGGIGKVTGVVTKPLTDAMGKLTSKIKSPRALDKQLDDIARQIRKNRAAVDGLNQLAARIGKNPGSIKKIFLNPDLMCGGNPKRIQRALQSAGLMPTRPRRKADLMDGLFIGEAHAARDTNVFFAFSVAASGGPVAQPINAISVTYVVGTEGSSRVYFSPGRAFRTAPGWDDIPGMEFSFAAYVFPWAKASDFSGIGSLGGELSVHLHGAAKKIASVLTLQPPGRCGPRGRILCPRSFLFSFDPIPPFSGPGFGLEWNLFEIFADPVLSKQDPKTVAGTIDVSIPMK